MTDNDDKNEFQPEQTDNSTFSSDQESISEILSEIQFQQEVKKDSETPVGSGMEKAMLISFGVAILGVIISFFFDTDNLCRVLVIQVFAVFGIGFFYGCMKQNIHKKITGFSLWLSVGVGGCAIVAGILAAVLRQRDILTAVQYRHIKSFLVDGAMVAIGLFQIVPTIYYRIKLKRRCTESVTATCEELKTIILYEKNDRPVYGTVPVWRYSFNGEEYTVEDNVYSKGTLHMAGDKEEILIDPDEPDCMLSRYGLPHLGARLIAGIIIIAIAIYFIVHKI